MFEVDVEAPDGDLTWHLELAWVAGGRPGHGRLPVAGVFRASRAPDTDSARPAGPVG
ncbi:hypothetical protein ACH47V_25160 [Micromonospora chersina]|uniref:hypothetical protein n=1 Tax=Micromonospora chersina TaxID=47854 RepID=UPI0033EDE164